MSDWSNGHLYTAIADRPVSEDGRMGYIETLPVRSYDNLFPYKDKSPSSSRDYWLCKAFSTDDENLSLGILHMLSTSGDEGYIKMNLYVKNTSKTVEILNNILVLNRSVSRELLINNYNFDVDQADEVLMYTHPENPSPMVLVTSDKMIGTGHWTFKFGEWNFDEKHSNDYIYSVGDVNKAEDFLNSTNDVFLDLKTGNITWKNKTPYCLDLVNNGTLKKRYVNPNSHFCIFIIDNTKVVVFDRVFENSIFTRLVIEKDNSTVFKRLYANNNVVVWGTKN
jgi:dolichyl-diphosphooligosaccharide--protein glycosyltransferase